MNGSERPTPKIDDPSVRISSSHRNFPHSTSIHTSDTPGDILYPSILEGKATSESPSAGFRMSRKKGLLERPKRREGLLGKRPAFNRKGDQNIK